MGENFLHQASLIMGSTALGAAMGELHVAQPGTKQNVADRIYEIFLGHVPDNRRQDFCQLYQELHGGAAAFPDIDYSDDHGDGLADATRVEEGQIVYGDLDYMFDFDYFRFHTSTGQKYTMHVDHETSRPTSIGLYGRNGMTSEHGNWKSRELTTDGPRIVWIAPDAGEYYFAVHNFGGKSGGYTLTITSVEASPADDYGDTPATATGILVGESVQGTIVDDFDIDYFEFPVRVGKRYRLEITSGTLEDFQFRMRAPGNRWYRFTAEAYRSWAPPGFAWTSRGSGQVSLGIDGIEGSVGTYTVKITLLDDAAGT